jgi:hypothetical protein
MKRHFFSCWILVSAFYFSAKAQHISLFGPSPSYSQIGKITNKYGYAFNAMSAINAFDQTVEGKYFPASNTHTILTGLGTYQVNKSLTLAAGYAFGRHHIFGLKEHEHRGIFQASYQTKFKQFVFTHRGRYEYRVPTNLKTNITSDAHIGRYQFWVTLPLYNTQKQKKGFFLSASNEAFLYFKGATNGPVSSKNGALLSENWTHLGGGYNAGRTRYEVAYCYQDLVRNAAQDHRKFNLLQLNIYHTVSWQDIQSWWYL